MKSKNNIVNRDKYWYVKENGAIPAGYTIHHLWYSEEYDPASFIIIPKEEHNKIHGKNTGVVHSDFNPVEYRKKYREEHREEIRAKQLERYYANHEENKEKQNKRRAEHREEYNAYMRAYRAKKKLEKESGEN